MYCWCSCKDHDACRALSVGAPAKIMMHAGYWPLVLLQRSWCMQGIDAWCSCKNHDACRVLIVGAPAKIMMHARHWPLMLLQRSRCMQDTDHWCSCKDHDACKTLTVGAPAKIMMHAGCWLLVHLQRSWCHLTKSQLWHCKKIMMSQEYLVPGTPEEIAILFKAVPGWNHNFLTWTGVCFKAITTLSSQWVMNSVIINMAHLITVVTSRFWCHIYFFNFRVSIFNLFYCDWQFCLFPTMCHRHR